MNALQILARSLTGATYALLGFDAARAPGPRVEMAKPTIDAIRRVVPLPVDDDTVVRANGALQSVSGALLAAGVYPRLNALFLAGSLVPTTLAGHSFWKCEDPVQRKLQQTQFRKNVAMLGGLLSAVAVKRPYESILTR